MQLRDIANFQRTKTSKGFVINGRFIGLTIKYHPNGKLKSAGHFNTNSTDIISFPGGRRIGHWKFYDEEGVVSREEIHIR